MAISNLLGKELVIGLYLPISVWIKGEWNWCNSRQRHHRYFNSQDILQRLLGALGIPPGEGQV